MIETENQFRRPCRQCRRTVDVGEGIMLFDVFWKVFCSEHIPSRRARLGPTGKLVWGDKPDVLHVIPGITHLGDKTFQVSTAVGDRERVIAICEHLGIDVDPGFRDYELTTEAKLAEGEGLYPFQIKAVNYTSSKSRVLLALDMGCGKTVTALKALPRVTRAVAVVPACVKYNWSDEVEKWCPYLKPVVINGRGNFRWPEENEIIITNFELLPARFVPPSQQKKELSEEEKDKAIEDPKLARDVYMIVDECHNVKSWKADRSKKVRTMAQMCKAVWGLTGTPLMNSPGDLWGVLQSLDMHRQVFGDYRRFVKLFKGKKNRWGGMMFGNPDPVVPHLLRKVMYRKRREEVLPELPDKTYTTITVPIDRSLKKKLDEIFQEWAPALKFSMELPDFSEFSEIRKELAMSRVPAMLEHVAECEAQDVPVLVFSAHRAPVEVMKDREGWRVILGDTPAERRQEIVREFQSGKLKGVALTIKAGGVGLTLTRAWKAYFVDLDWVPANNSQAEDRICRIGQEANKVEIVRMKSNHALDDHVMSLLTKKMRISQRTIEAADNMDMIRVEREPEEEQMMIGIPDEEVEVRAKFALEMLERRFSDKIDVSDLRTAHEEFVSTVEAERFRPSDMMMARYLVQSYDANPGDMLLACMGLLLKHAKIS